MTTTPTAWQQRIPGPQLPGFVSAVTLVAGIWLLLAPVVWDYGNTAGRFDAQRNALLTGLLLTAVGVAGSAAGSRSAWPACSPCWPAGGCSWRRSCWPTASARTRAEPRSTTCWSESCSSW
jgi:hypothetical protein